MESSVAPHRVSEVDGLWLPVSLFCYKERFRRLLAEGIKPLLQRLTGNHHLHHYLLAIDAAGGDHLRLLLSVPAAHAREIAVELDDHFKTYFSQAPGLDKEIVCRADGLFAPYAVYTTHYGLYAPGQLLAGFAGDIQLQQPFSTLIMEVFSVQQVSEQALVLLAFQFYLGLMSQVCATGQVGWDELLVPSQDNLLQDRAPVDWLAIHHAFEEYRHELFEVSRAILADSPRQPVWIVHWTMICRGWLAACGSADARQPYRQLAGLIDRHLGLTPGMKFIAFYFLRKVVAS
ncbi:hypothetical protein [Paraflavitalea pollutisoli]|uniref:hypothetical protein n=1 Tax=Paraflavitalea pollutisoli TaxID=3034143 RepID=UPI0023ED52E8|nr:hypothetical protein [Paraflavitalea sp. H1-2-19X]